MRTLTTIEHSLEASFRGGCFASALGHSRLLDRANTLAMNGLLAEALRDAYDVAAKNRDVFGECDFRIVTTERTITVLGSWESSGVMDGRG